MHQRNGTGAFRGKSAGVCSCEKNPAGGWGFWLRDIAHAGFAEEVITS